MNTLQTTQQPAVIESEQLELTTACLYNEGLQTSFRDLFNQYFNNSNLIEGEYLIPKFQVQALKAMFEMIVIASDAIHRDLSAANSAMIRLYEIKNECSLSDFYCLWQSIKEMESIQTIAEVLE